MDYNLIITNMETAAVAVVVVAAVVVVVVVVIVGLEMCSRIVGRLYEIHLDLLV
jgi:hypothetical protein